MVIALLTSDFIPTADANGICVNNIAKEYVQAGHRVLCIANQTDNLPEYEVIDGIEIYRVKSAWFGRFYRKYSTGGVAARALCKAVHLLRNICLFPFYPNTAPVRTGKVYRLAKRLYQENKADLVIGAYRPYESIYAIHKLKKTFGNKVKCLALYLDILPERQKLSVGGRLYAARTQWAQKKDLRCLDGVFIPVSYRAEFEKSFGTDPKMHCFDFPLYTKPQEIIPYTVPFVPEAINLAYVGTLDSNNRNPERMLQLLRQVSQRGMPLKLHIWGKILGVEQIIADYADIVRYHGYLEYSFVPSVLQQADFLVSISNKVHCDMIPSKIFQLFATGKPIINFVSNKEDKSLTYFERYGNVQTVWQISENTLEKTDELIRFLNEPKERVSTDEVFKENTPAWVAQKLIFGMENHEN